MKVNFNKIRREKNIGQQSNDIVAYMAYLSPNQINIKEIFLQKKSGKDKQQILDALDRLHKFSVTKLEESIAKVHNGVQKTVKVEKERAGTEEETLREIMTSFYVTSTNHIISIWSHASKYSKLVNEFIDFTYDGGTVLHLLAKYDNKKVIKLILEKIDPKKLSEVINVVDEEDLTALDYAAMYGHLEIVKYFIDNGYFKLDKLIEENNATLYYAVKHGHLDIVKYFIEKLDSMNLHDLGDISPIHFAAESGHLDIVKYFIEKGISVNLQDLDGMSSVHWAAKDGHLYSVKYLVEKGANVNLQNKEGDSPLHWAAHNGHLDIVKYLAEIDLRDKCGMRPVCYAIVNGHLDIAEYLLEQGANMNLKNNYNNTPLDCAIIADNLDIAEYLLERRAKMHQKSKDFLYHYATVNGYSDIICYLKAYPTVYSASDSKAQSRKKQQKALDEHTLPKKRRLENMSAASEENASNIQLLQGSQDNVNLPSDIPMRREGPFDRMEDMVSVTNKIPMFSFNSVAVEPVNNKNLRR